MLLFVLIVQRCGSAANNVPTTVIEQTAAPFVRFDGIGGLSGGGATSTFLMAYEEDARNAILDWMFKPDYAGSLDILKVEIGADDQTTDGCEACHMRSPTEVNCSRGYEWPLMMEAVKRNANITLYGLPWGFAGWLGFGTTNPYHNVTATADYVATWVECGATHGLNITMLGLWNEAWQADGRPATDPWDYALALRKRLDSTGKSYVRIIAPDGDISSIIPALNSNSSYKAATWGLGAHYPGGSGTTPAERNIGLPLWSSEDYSTYSDATGAGCWARLLVQNAGWGYGATISWYLLGAFARGMDYDSDGVIRAEWPSSGHWEVTPMLWMTMHWTLFTEPGWSILSCPTPQCTLAGGGNYIALAAPSNAEMTIIVETFQHKTSQCIRKDPKNFPEIAPTQIVTIILPEELKGTARAARKEFEVFRSCTGWRYPANDDDYMIKLSNIAASAAGNITFTATRDCYYTLTTVTGKKKPVLPSASTLTVRPAAFPLPFSEDFEGRTVGSEAPFFGDQEGKWETVPASGGRTGLASQQQLPASNPWPILEPQCNQHSQPISIIGDLFFESTRVSADVLIEEDGVGAGLALRVRNVIFFRGPAPAAGLYLYLGATPAQTANGNPGGKSPGENKKLAGWALCADSYCLKSVKNGSLPAGAPPMVHHWHAVVLEVTHGFASGKIDNVTIFEGIPVSQQSQPPPPSGSDVAHCVANTTVITGKVIAGGDYKQVPLTGPIPAQIEACEKACCSDIVCTAWAVVYNKCWLKNGGDLEDRAGETACAFKPKGPAAGTTSAAGVPPSGWAGIVSTLGLSSVDNFELRGTADAASSGGAAAPRCNAGIGGSSTRPPEGTFVTSTPCDLPGTLVSWALSKTNGALQLRNAGNGQHSHDGGSGELCIGVKTEASGVGGGGNVSVVACGSGQELAYKEATGQIITPGGGGQNCLTAVQKSQAYGAGPPQIVVAACQAIPSESQQFQYNPDTGALRQKGSQCIATFDGGVLNYRDCCVAVCVY